MVWPGRKCWAVGIHHVPHRAQGSFPLIPTMRSNRRKRVVEMHGKRTRFNAATNHHLAETTIPFSLRCVSFRDPFTQKTKQVFQWRYIQNPPWSWVAKLMQRRGAGETRSLCLDIAAVSCFKVTNTTVVLKLSFLFFEVSEGTTARNATLRARWWY